MSKAKKSGRKGGKERDLGSAASHNKDKEQTVTKRVLTVQDGNESALTGVGIFFLRTSTKRTLGEETFQREIMCGMVNAQEGDYLLWNVERTISRIYIPVLLTQSMADKGCKDLLTKVKKELLPCLRSFTSSLRVAELVWKEGSLIKDYPPESYEIKNLEDVWEYLKTENAVPKFEGEFL